MDTQIDFRKDRRLEHKSTALIEEESGGYFSYGQTSNYSNGGLCFLSDVVFKIGSKVKIRPDNLPFKTAPKSYSGIVKWCKELGDNDSQHLYGVGVKYF
jgi:hypothetical protein